MNSRRNQGGYLLVTVVVTLFMIASIAVLLSHDSAISANTSSKELESSRAEYVAAAGMQHALWRAQNNACIGDVTIPDTALGADTYNASMTGAAAGTLVTVSADQDAWIRSDDVTRNNGTTAGNHVRNEAAGTEQVLTRFDISSIAAKAQISSAIAWFHLKAGKTHPQGPINVHEITADWTETGVTWESFAGRHRGARIAMLPAQDAGDVWVAINLAGVVQSWVNGRPNYGILFDTQAEGIHTEYTAREDGTNPPRLEVVIGSGQASPVTIKAKAKLDNGVLRDAKDRLASAYQPPSTTMLQLGTDPGADAMLDSFYERNYGGSDYIQINADPGFTQRPVLRFDLGGIPAGARVVSAILEMRLLSLSVPGTATAHELTRSFVEGTKAGGGTADGATWGTYDGTGTWANAGGDFSPAVADETTISSTDTWVSWDISGLVQKWMAGEPNYGLLLQGANGLDKAKFASREEADPALRPKLTISYACECGNACMAPRGSGNILMVVRNATNMWYYDSQKKAILESWGYTVNIIDDDASQADYDAGVAANDVAYISEPSQEASLSTKLSDAPIGVVSDEGRMNDELGMAQFFATPVLGKAINVSDTSHYITSVFPGGPLDIYTADMEGLTVSGNVSPNLQTLADWGGAGSLVLLDAGMQAESGGTVAGRRVMLPFGRQVDSNVNWERLNSNGLLIAQRAIEWAIGVGGDKGKNVLLVVGDAGSPLTSETDRKSLIESWGYEVTLISDHALQAEFDAALADVDVAYIAGSGSSTAVGTKLTAATIGVLSEDMGLVDELGIAQPSFLKRNSQSIDIFDNTHYVTSGFSLGTLQLYSYVPEIWTVTGLYAPGLQILAGTEASGSSFPPGLAFLEADAELWGGGFAAGRRVQVPWAQGSFDINALNADGKTIMRRAIEWGAGAGCGKFVPLLFVVSDDVSPTSNEVDRQTLFESWCYAVTLLDDSDSQANFDSATAANDVAFVSSSIGGGALADKLTGSTIPIVNEFYGKLDNFGFSSSTSTTISSDIFTATDAGHYITEPNAGAAVTVFDSALSMPVPGGTLAPGLQNIAEVSGTPALAALESGGLRYDGNPAPARRVHLPLGNADDTQITDDGKTLMRRAIEWAADGAGGRIAHWKLDETSDFTAVDSIGGNDGTLQYGPAWTTGQVDGGLDFDGVDDIINVGAPATLDDIFNGGGTVTAWIYPRGWGANDSGRVVDKWNNNTNGWLFTLYGGNQSLMVQRGFSGAFGNWHTPAGSIDLDSWQHVAVVYDDSSDANDPALFINGVPQTVTEWYTPSGTPGSDAGIVLNIGDRTVGSTRRTFDGILDDVRIYDRILDLPEIAALAAEGGGGGGGGGGGSCNGPFGDTFDAVNYGGGTANWATNWQETGESTSPSGGDIRIANDIGNYQLLVRDDGQTVWREAELSSGTSATLSFDYRRQNLSGTGDYVAVEVSYDGGTNWAELARFTGTATDSSYTNTSYPLDAGQLSTNTRIRFRTPNSGMSNSNMVWFDNVEIACTP